MRAGPIVAADTLGGKNGQHRSHERDVASKTALAVTSTNEVQNNLKVVAQRPKNLSRPETGAPLARIVIMKYVSLRTAVIVGAACATGLSGLAFAAGSLRASTTADLMDAMHGEAFAALKYAAYADAAREEGNPQLADLFARTAETERVEHFVEHARLASLVGSNADNLRDAIKGENYETNEMYPQMATRAKAVGDKAVAQHFREVGADEARQRDAFQSALEHMTVEVKVTQPSVQRQ